MRRRLLPAALLSVTLLAGCGDDSSSSSDSSPVSNSVSNSASTTASSNESGPAIPSDCPVVTPDTTPVASFPDGKPAVEIPSESPSELVITDLFDGSGEPAKEGDVVEVNYVGVRTADGTEFDNSYDRGETFPVTLGTGGVIQGWEQGLIGIKVGGRRQLDIPADLAYGDNPQGDIIQPGDALTFVIDAVSVKSGPPTADPADEPVIEVPTSTGAAAVTVTDLVEGDRCLIALAGQTVFIQYVLYRGDTGEELESSWTTGTPIDLALDEANVPAIVDGIIGMGVGGRRLLILPPALGFGAEANAQMGLDATTDIVMLVDLVQIG